MKKKPPVILAARSVVRKTKSARLLTSKEKEFVAQALIGNVEEESKMYKSPLVLESLIEAIDNLKIDHTYVAKHIKEGLEGTKLFGKEAIEHPDWANRHKYFTSLLELTKIKQSAGGDSRSPSTPGQYKSHLRGKVEIIDVTPPAGRQAQRRLLAARPTNRKGA